MQELHLSMDYGHLYPCGVKWLPISTLQVMFKLIWIFFCISEDILRQDNAIWISPDGKKVVYATFNDSQVQSVRWKIYGNGYDASVNPYPKEAFMRYPKVGI